MVDRALRLPPGTKFMVLAPYVSGKKGEYRKQMAEMVKEGFLRARVDGKFVDLDDPPELDKQKKHTIEIVVDRLVAKPGEDEEYRKRLADSIETATRVSGGLIVLSVADGPEEVLSANYACPDCGTSLDGDHAAPVLVQLPLRRVHRPARASGTNLKADPERLVQDPSKSIEDGAIAILKPGSTNWRSRQMATLAKHYKFRLTEPFGKLSKAAAERHPLRLGRGRDQVLLRGREGRVPLALVLRGARPHDRAPLPGDREPRAPGGARGATCRPSRARRARAGG